MFQIDFDHYRSSSPRGRITIANTVIFCSPPIGGMTIPAGGGIHALVAAPTTDVVSLPAVNEIEIDGDASGPPCLIEFMSSPGVILRAETVSGTGRFRRGWSAAGTIIIRLTGLELILYGLRGT